MLHRQARAAQILIQELSRRVGSVPGGSSIPHRAGTTVVSSERSSNVGSSRTGSVHTSIGLVDPHHCQFSRNQFQRRIGRSGRSSDDRVDVVAHSNAVFVYHNGTRSLSVVETAGISRPSTWEPHISESPRVRGGSLSFRCTRGHVGSFRHHDARVRETDDSCERTTERDSDGFCTRPGNITTRPHHSQFGFLRRRGFGGVVRRTSPRFRVALEERHRAEGEGDELAEEPAWKVFALVPRMLMHRVHGTGSVGRYELAARGELFVSQEFHSHWNTQEAVCQQRGGTKRHGSPGARAEGPGLTSQAGTGRLAMSSKKRGDFEGAPRKTSTSGVP